MPGQDSRWKSYVRTVAKILALLIVAIVVTYVFDFGLIALLWAYFLATTGSVGAATAAILDNISNMWFMIGLTVLQEIAWVLVAVGFVVFIDRRRFSWRDLGLFFRPQAAGFFLAGVLVNAVLGLATIACVFITGWQHISVNGLAVYGPAAVAGSLALTLVLMLAVGIGEETLFRGYIQTDLMRKYGCFRAVIVTSLAFALLHVLFLIPGQEVSPLSITGIFVASLVMGYLYIITGTIWTSIGFHFFQDFLAAGVFLTGDLPYVSYPAFTMSQAGNIILLGVDLGSKDNLINIVLMLVLLALLFVYYKNRPSKAKS